MELFDPTYLESQLFWTALSFLILLGFIKWAFVPKVAGTLDRRAERIRSDLEHAEKLRRDAENTLAEYNRQMEKAREEASQIVAKAREEAKDMVDTRTQELEKELSRRSEEAQRSIEHAKTQALQEVQKDVAELVMLATEKLIGENVDSTKANKLADEAIKSMTH